MIGQRKTASISLIDLDDVWITVLLDQGKHAGRHVAGMNRGENLLKTSRHPPGSAADFHTAFTDDAVLLPVTKIGLKLRHRPVVEILLCPGIRVRSTLAEDGTYSIERGTIPPV